MCQFQDQQLRRFADEDGINFPYVWSVIEDAPDQLWIGRWGVIQVGRCGGQIGFEVVPGLESMSAPERPPERVHRGRDVSGVGTTGEWRGREHD